jgi:hypothetical protein
MDERRQLSNRKKGEKNVYVWKQHLILVPKQGTMIMKMIIMG